MSQEDMIRFNDAHIGEALVVTSGSATHFTTADVVLHIYEQLYSVALAKQRKRPACGDMLIIVGIICIIWHS